MNTIVKSGSLAACGFLILSFASAGQKHANSTLSSQDKAFIGKAAQGGMAEVQFGKLASEKGRASSVRSFGDRMVQDHSAANDKLMGIAKDLGFMPPAGMDAKQKASYKKLQRLSGAAFDKMYSKMMVQDHHEDISLFQRESNTGHNRQVKQFATQTLPTLKHHLAMTKELPK